MRTPIVIRNTSRYPTVAVSWLLDFAAAYVRKEMHRMGSGDWFDQRGFHVHFGNKTNACYSGYYFSQHVNERGGYPMRGETEYRRVLVKIGAPHHFPMRSWDGRYKDMPEGMLNDWQEAAVAIAAHEFSHVKFNGRRDGEEACDLIMHDAVDAFRKARSEFDEAMARAERRAEERELAVAAKKSPESVASARLAKAERMLKAWTRKSKLAQAKVKRYTRELRGAQARVAKLAEGGAS